MNKTIKFSNCNCEITRGKFDINNILLDCPAVWKLISSGYTTGVFQLEKKLGQDWARKAKPQNIEELAALTAILRPGSLEAGMSDEYVNVKLGKKKITYLHPCLEPILKSTYGCLIYQEQALEIAKEIAGFSLEEADSLRKAIGKKIPKLMAELKEKFINGSKKTGLVPRGIAEEIFGWIEKCQRYNFNKSHARSYAETGYMTAWLKCHCPQEFFTSYLTHSQHKGDPKEEIYRLIQDARLFGIQIFAPDIRKRNIDFEIVKKQKEGIAFGLGHIKGVGKSAISKIISKNISFNTWTDFLISVPELHRNVGIALIKAGACDCFGLQRSEMIKQLELILGTTNRDETGKKIEIRGLTPKEREFVFKKLNDGNDLRDIFEFMSQDPDNFGPRLKDMKKSELVELIDKEFYGAIDTSKLKKNDLIQLLIENGYKDPERSPCTDKRRHVILDKMNLLNQESNDTNMAKATAEKYFLGIALSCSAADDVDNSIATHRCIDVAKSNNNEQSTVCAVIESVKHTKTKRGKNPGSPMCFLTISDSTYAIDHAVVFPNAYKRLKNLCKEDLICLIGGEKKNGSFIIEDIEKLM